MTSQNVHVLISETCEYVTVHENKRGISNVVMLEILRWGNYPGGPNVVT